MKTPGHGSRLAIISSHPIQYNAPWFFLLAQEPGIKLRVFYTWSQRKTNHYDVNFGKTVRWDIPLLEGYDYTFIDNTSADPGNHHFKGIVCQTLIGEITNWNATHLLVFGWNFQAHLKTMRHFKRKIPVLFRGDSTMLDDKPGLKSILRWIVLKWVYQFVDIALYTGQSNKYYFQIYGLKEHQLIFAPHAIDNTRFSNNHGLFTEQAAMYGKKLKIDSGDKVILFVGKFEPKKDPFLLLEAYKQLLLEWENPKELKLVFVGDGELEGSLKEIAKDISGISFVPFQNQTMMPVIYRLGRTLCLPSQGPGETWGLAINEAMACGTPCLISDKAGSAADLGSFEGNEVFQAGNVSDLTDKLSILLKNDSFENNHFLKTWSYQQLVEGILKAIEKPEFK